MIRIATVRALIIVAVSLVLGIPVALAQTVPTPPPATAPASPQDAAEQRVRSLRTELHITDAQMPRWSAFAQAMRDNAISTDTLFRQRASAAQSMSALDNMKSYAQVARAYADNTENLSAAFEALYRSVVRPAEADDRHSVSPAACAERRCAAFQALAQGLVHDALSR